jgi:hypothetical protein
LIVLIVIGSLVALAILLLCIPVKLEFTADFGPVWLFRVNVVWLFGLVHLSPKRRGKQDQAIKKERASPGERLQQLRTILRIVKIKGLTRQFLKLLTSCLKAIRFRQAGVDLNVGLGDPGDTGMLFSIIGPATPFLSQYAPFPVNIRPLLADDPGITGWSWASLYLQPIRIAGPMLQFLFSRPCFRLMKIMAVQRWKRKR